MTSASASAFTAFASSDVSAKPSVSPIVEDSTGITSLSACERKLQSNRAAVKPLKKRLFSMKLTHWIGLECKARVYRQTVLFYQ